MARSQQHKAESRKAILRSAARLFRQRGIDGVTVAEVMQDAGLTHGGFPRHFAGKQELVTEAMAELFETNKTAPLLPSDSVQAMARVYLRPEHRDAVGQGCVFAALGPELARSPEATRATLTEEIRRQIDILARNAPRDQAIGAWSAMVGAMVLARISTDTDLSDEVLEATRSFLGT